MTAYVFAGIPLGAEVTVYRHNDDDPGPKGTKPYGDIVYTGIADSAGTLTVDLPTSSNYKATWWPGSGVVWQSPNQPPSVAAADVAAAIATQHAADNSIYVPAVATQSAEGAFVDVFTIQPKTAGAPPFQVRASSTANPNGGAGYDHLFAMGWNAVRTVGGGGGAANKAAVVMGFEDNYYDGAQYGCEWYVEYFSPDGTSIRNLRPLFARFNHSDNNTASNCQLICDIGTDGTGQFEVTVGITGTLLAVRPTITYMFTPVNITGPGSGLSIQPTTGQATLKLISASAPSLMFQSAFNTTSWYWQALSTDDFTVSDKNGRGHFTLTQGASNAAALTELKSSVKVDGNIGFYGHAPVTQPAAPVTLADVIAVVRGCGLSA